MAQDKIQLIRSAGETNYSYRSCKPVARRICPYCGQEYTRFEEEIEYISCGKYFCSYQCKVRYNRTIDEKLKFEKYKQYNKTILIDTIKSYDPSYNVNELKKKRKEELFSLLVEILQKLGEKSNGKN